MSHTASKNWRNRRKDPDKGIRTGEPGASRNAVKVLLSGSEAEALEFIRRHVENRAWLKLAAEVESGKPAPRRAVLSMTEALLTQLERGMA